MAKLDQKINVKEIPEAKVYVVMNEENADIPKILYVQVKEEPREPNEENIEQMDTKNHFEGRSLMVNIKKETSSDCDETDNLSYSETEDFKATKDTSYKCQMCNQSFTVFTEYKLHKKQHFIEKKTCKICNVVCQSISKLEDHVNKHLGVKPFNCDECGKAFLSKHHVKLHKKCHNTEDIYQCDKCDKTFKNKASVRSHQLVHSKKIMEFKCKICHLDCLSLPEFRKHMDSHGEKSEIKCGLCDKTFKTDRGLENHVKFHKELTYPCEYCGKIYPSMYRIKRHIKRAHVANECEICKQVFYDRALFTKHNKQHNETKNINCQYCNKLFDKAKNLSEHIRLQHKQEDTMKKCQICDKQFINTALLKNHVKTHNKCFKCPHCDRVFASRYNLETHSVTHSGKRNHKCLICGKAYTTKTSLKNHAATHSDERTFECDQCAKTFKTNRRLYVHKFSHATEEKFQCEICLQKFRVKQYLKYHMIKHSTVKPFECEICTKRFKHKKSFEKHMAVGRHKKNEFEHECDFCDGAFPSRDLLVEHFAEVHHKENAIDGLEDCEGMEMESCLTESGFDKEDSVGNCNQAGNFERVDIKCELD